MAPVWALTICAWICYHFEYNLASYAAKTNPHVPNLLALSSSAPTCETQV